MRALRHSSAPAAPTPHRRDRAPTRSRRPRWQRRPAEPRRFRSVADQYPQYATQIVAAAKASFLAGDQYAYVAGIIAVLLGAALVFFLFPKRDKERELLMEYHRADTAAMKPAAGTGIDASPTPPSAAPAT